MEELREIALEIQDRFLKKYSSKNITEQRLTELNEAILFWSRKFTKKSYELCYTPAFLKIKKEQIAWQNHTNFPLEDEFENQFFESVRKALTYILSDKNLSNFNWPATIISKTGQLMMDSFRKINKAGFIDNSDRVEAVVNSRDLSVEDKIDLEDFAKKILRKFQVIIPSKSDRVFLRWYWIYKPGDKNIALIYDYSNVKSVKLKRNRLMKKILKEIEKEKIIASQEFNMIQDIESHNEAILEVDVSMNVEEKLTQLLIKGEHNVAKEKFKLFFQTQLEKWILLRWEWLLSPQSLFMANVYECHSLDEFHNYKNQTKKELLEMLHQNRLIKLK